MSFDRLSFWLFFVVAWSAWRFLPFSLAKTSALGLSLVFYAWWNPLYLILIAGSAVVDFHAGARIHAARDAAQRKRWLIVSLTVNLGLLAIFKYAPFTVENTAALARLLGVDAHWSLPGWVIPVGISFYTFQTLSYSIDIYRGQLEPSRSFRDFFLFVSFFPQLVAGPIVRARRLLPQFERRRKLRTPTVLLGLYYIVCGLFLKVVVADNLAPAIGSVFRMHRLEQLGPGSVWLGVIYSSVQFFADFAGYSGIAIGLACVMGLRFPENFKYPFISRSMSEVWTRWHISLSLWFRDYVYIPLGGSRSGPWRFYGAIMITMLISGLWHGPKWTYVLWGAVHGLGIWIERAFGGGRSRKADSRPVGVRGFCVGLSQIALTHFWWLITIVFFRAESFAMARLMLQRMFVDPFRGWFGELDVPGVENARYLVLIIPVVLLHGGQLLHEWYGMKKHALLRAAVAGLFLFLLLIFRRDHDVEFIYFQF